MSFLANYLQEIEDEDAEWEALCERIRERVVEEKDKLDERIKKRLFESFGQYCQKEIRMAFNSAVSSFYESYNPKYYDRRGDPDNEEGGLYDLLSMETDDYDIPVYDRYVDLIDPSEMHGGRHGSDVGLYDIVFVKGYHGGATKIAPSKVSKWGAHPNPGIPYWRTGQGFARWGRQARKSSDSPLDLFVENMKDVEAGYQAEFSKLGKKIENEEYKDFKSVIVPRILKECGW